MIQFFGGVIVGGIVGVIAMAFCNAAKEGSDE